jgi:hypothetical protein
MKTNNTLYDTTRYEHGYRGITPVSAREESSPEYVYVKKGANTYTDAGLEKYAQISGFYSDVGSTSTTKAGIVGLQGDINSTDKPLKCNVVYPSILDNMTAESTDKGKNYKCLYAKACDIPWTQAECEYVPQK